MSRSTPASTRNQRFRNGILNISIYSPVSDSREKSHLNRGQRKYPRLPDRNHLSFILYVQTISWHESAQQKGNFYFAEWLCVAIVLHKSRRRPQIKACFTRSVRVAQKYITSPGNFEEAFLSTEFLAIELYLSTTLF